MRSHKFKVYTIPPGLLIYSVKQKGFLLKTESPKVYKTINF